MDVDVDVDDMTESVPASNIWVITVSCSYERYHDWRVAFAEELAARRWPKSWTVDIKHTDLNERRIEMHEGVRNPMYLRHS